MTTALWSELVELGWPGIAIAEEHGGQGLGAVELAILAEELGYAVAASPFLATVMAAEAIGAGGTAEQQARVAAGPGVGRDHRRAGRRATASCPTPTPPRSSSWSATTARARVIAREDADVTPVDSDRPDPPRRARVRRRRRRRRARRLRRRPSTARWSRSPPSWSASAQRALEMTLAYVKDRKQFDTPVGAYQAVSHRCAQMLKDTEGARSVGVLRGVGRRRRSASACPRPPRWPRPRRPTAARDVTASAIQAHGGIGFTWEADVHWLYKRAQVDAALLGTSGQHRRRLAALLVARLAPAAAA